MEYISRHIRSILLYIQLFISCTRNYRSIYTFVYTVYSHGYYLQIVDKTDCITSAAIAAPPPAATLSYEANGEAVFDDSTQIKLHQKLSSIRSLGQRYNIS